MLITEFDLYWITRLDHIRDAMVATAGVCVVVGFVMSIALVANDIKRWRVIVPVLTTLISAFFVFGTAFIPTTKEMCAIKVIPMIANNRDVQGLGNDMVELAKEWMGELKPAKKGVAQVGELDAAPVPR